MSHVLNKCHMLNEGLHRLHIEWLFKRCSTCEMINVTFFYEIASIKIFLTEKKVWGAEKNFLKYFCCCCSIPLGSPKGKKVLKQLFLLRVRRVSSERTRRRKSCWGTFFPAGEPRGMLKQQHKYWRKIFLDPKTFSNSEILLLKRFHRKQYFLSWQ